jgi:type I restriction enzyme R subunit
MFTEQSTVELYIRDLLCGKQSARPSAVAEAAPTYLTPGRGERGAGWHFVPPAELPRRPDEVFVGPFVRDALLRLNPAIAAAPDRADEVIHKLRAIVLAVRGEGLIRANELFTGWLRGEMSMPFGRNHEHVTIRLIDFDDLDANQYVVTTQYTIRAGAAERRADLVLLVNGLPLVVVEAKTPVRPSVSWFDGARQISDDYERFVPELFAPNVFNVATEGKTLRYGAIGAPVELWGPWQEAETTDYTDFTDSKEKSVESVKSVVSSLPGVGEQLRSLLRPAVVLDMLAHFTLFATDKGRRRLKIVGRYQQVEGANLIVQRVLAGAPRKGLIWHFQGSGKSLLMVFAAQKLRLAPELRNPTVLIVVDRVDLDAQISATFHAADIPNLVKADSRAELARLLRQDSRKVIITTIHKFAEAGGELNERDNIVVLVDEAHRTQEGDLGLKMRAALPNAFLFGLTGTPINRRDRNTFYAFGAAEDKNGYLSRYGFEESIRDGATLPLHFEPRLVELHIDKAAIDQAYAELTGGLSDLDREMLARAASRLAILLKTPDRVQKICADIAGHFQARVAPNGFKGLVVTFDQESCLLYKEALDQFLPPEASEVVISVSGKERDDERYRRYRRGRDEEEALLDRFRDANDPLQLLIVTAKLLTGFDAPILQAMYLDKPLRDHTLLQAITRTNRTYGERKTHGLIVDYLGVFDDIATALEFDEATIRQVVSNIAALAAQLPEALAACLAYFPDVDRTDFGYEGLIAAQQCLPDNAARDAFAADYSVLSQLWEALSPDPALRPHEADYRWLSQVYLSLQPSTGDGALLWHALGAKTIELIHQNVRVVAIHDDLEAIVLDADLLEAVLSSPNPDQKAHEIQIKIAERLRRHQGNPRFRALSERLEALKERHEQGQLHSVEFLKQLLDLARELLEAEKETPPEEDEDRGQAALTELFEAVRTADTPVIVERLVADIDDIVRQVRFPGWQGTTAGEREVRKALRKTLFKYKLHQDVELFEKAFGYVRQYY